MAPTQVQRSLLQLGQLLPQRAVVGAQAPVGHQQEAAEPVVPRVRPLQAVLTGHVEAPLLRGDDGVNVSLSRVSLSLSQI